MLPLDGLGSKASPNMSNHHVRPDEGTNDEGEASRSVGNRLDAIQQVLFEIDQKISAPPTLQPLLTTQQVAAFLNVSKRTVQDMMAAREIPFIMLGKRSPRFDLLAVRASLSSRAM